MHPLIISRKSKNGFGGLNRFYAELSRMLPKHYTISPDSLSDVFKIFFRKPTHIYVCDATLLPLGIVLKVLLRKPLIVTAHGLDITYKNPLYQKMIHFLLPRTDAIALDSNPTKKLLQTFTLSQPIHVIPLGITTHHLQESTPIPLLSGKNNIILTTVGNLVKRKGHVWFINRVMPFLPENYCYAIVGNGPEEKAIRKSVRKHNLSRRVFLLGQLSHKELRFVLSKTDIYVSPNQHTLGNFESFGIANGEAARLGLPVVASNVDGISEVIRNNHNGILISPTADNFITTLTALKDAGIRKRLGQKASAYTKKYYSWKETASAYTALFAQTDKN